MIRDLLLRDYFITDQILLKPLVEKDLYFTLEVRNTPEVRKYFVDNSIIAFDSHRRWFIDYLTKNDECMFCIFYNCVRAGQIGVYNYNKHQRSIEIGRLFIECGLQGNGIMRKVLSHVMNHICCVGFIDKILLSCKMSNSRAISLYNSLGFVTLTHRTKLIEGDLLVAMVYHCAPIIRKT